MRWEDWVPIRDLQLQGRHLLGVGAALASYFLISRLVEWVVGRGVLLTILRAIDQFVLVLVFLYFVGNLVYHLWQAIKPSGRRP